MKHMYDIKGNLVLRIAGFTDFVSLVGIGGYMSGVKVIQKLEIMIQKILKLISI